MSKYKSVDSFNPTLVRLRRGGLVGDVEVDVVSIPRWFD